MPDRVLLYLSAAPDLALERETLNKAIIEIPTSLGWRIKQTPGPDEKLDADAVAQAEVHLLITTGRLASVPRHGRFAPRGAPVPDRTHSRPRRVLSPQP